MKRMPSSESQTKQQNHSNATNLIAHLGKFTLRVSQHTDLEKKKQQL